MRTWRGKGDRNRRVSFFVLSTGSSKTRREGPLHDSDGVSGGRNVLSGALIDHELRDGEILLDLGGSSNEDGSESRGKMPVDVAMEELRRGREEEEEEERERGSAREVDASLISLRSLLENRTHPSSRVVGSESDGSRSTGRNHDGVSLERVAGRGGGGARQLQRFERTNRRRVLESDSHLSFDHGRVDLGIIGLDVPRSVNEHELVTVEMD